MSWLSFFTFFVHCIALVPFSSTFNKNIRGGGIKTSISLSRPSNNFSFERISFNWVQDLINKGNNRLSVEDVESLEESQKMYNQSPKLQELLQIESQKPLKKINGKPNIFLEYWKSPLTRALVTLYWKPLALGGMLKFANTLVQFTPSLLISQILKLIENRKLFSTSKAKGITFVITLFAILCLKTVLENQYFDVSYNLGTSMKTVLGAAVYQKTLKLSPSSRQNYTVSIVYLFC